MTNNYITVRYQESWNYPTPPQPPNAQSAQIVQQNNHYYPPTQPQVVQQNNHYYPPQPSAPTYLDTPPQPPLYSHQPMPQQQPIQQGQVRDIRNEIWNIPAAWIIGGAMVALLVSLVK